MRKKLSSCGCENFGCTSQNDSSEMSESHKILKDHCEAFIGKPAPEFNMPALLPGDIHGRVSLREFTDAGRWVILCFYPADFSSVCSTEVQQLSNLDPEFLKNNAQVISCSVDSLYVHQAWLADTFKTLAHPLASDPNHKVAKKYGVYDHAEGLAWRGLFIIAPNRTLWASYSTYKTAGRSSKEVLRLLLACQHSAIGKFVPCDWEEGKEFIKS